MKNIVLADPLSPEGHKDIDKVIIRLLKDYCNLVVITADEYLDEKFNNVRYISLKKDLFYISNNSLKNRKRLFQVLMVIKKYLKEIEDIDNLIIMSYDTITFSIWNRLFKGIPLKLLNKTYIYNHSNIDEIISSRIKNKMFNLISSDIHFVCYEEFIRNKVEILYQKQSIVIRHNISNYKKKFMLEKVRKELKQFFNDESFVISFPSTIYDQYNILSCIIKLDKSGYLRDHGIKIFIKRATSEYVSKNIMILNDYLTFDEYSYIFLKSNSIGIIYNPSEYVYRVSGVYFDALTFKKPVIYSKTLFFEDQVKRFGAIGSEYTQDMRKSIIDICNADYDELINNISKANNYYSDINVLSDLKGIIR